MYWVTILEDKSLLLTYVKGIAVPVGLILWLLSVPAGWQIILKLSQREFQSVQNVEWNKYTSPPPSKMHPTRNGHLVSYFIGHTVWLSQ